MPKEKKQREPNGPEGRVSVDADPIEFLKAALKVDPDPEPPEPPADEAEPSDED